MTSANSQSKFSSRVKATVLEYVPTKVQAFFMVLAIGVVVVLIKTLANYQEEIRTIKETNPNHDWPEWSDFWITLASLPVFLLAKVVVRKLFYRFYMKMIKDKYQGEVRIEKAEKGCKNTYKTGCFIIFTAMGYYVVPQLHFVPASLLGSGDTSLMYATHPVNPRPFFFSAYYLIELAYHFEGMISHAI